MPLFFPEAALKSETRNPKSEIQVGPASWPRASFLLMFAFLCGAATLKGAGGYSHRVPMDPESRDSIEVSSFMDNVPTAGFMPLRVTIDNRSTSDRSWRLNPVMNQGDWVRAEWAFSVKAGSRADFEIFVPLKSANFNYRWGAQFLWSGPGVDHGMMQLPQTGSGSSSNSHPFAGLSDSLHSKHWGAIQGNISDLSAAALDLAQAPADWRGWIALDQIWMTAGEWKALAKDKQQAVLEAVALRNELVLVCAGLQEAQEMRDAFKLTAEDQRAEWSFGAGQVRVRAGGVNGSSMAADIRKAGQKGATLQNYRLSPWFEKQTPPVETAGPLVLLFIVLFGVVAGPVNLFVFAPAGRRHRLFVTTPLISVVGALVLAVAIFIQDGTGGSGTRLIHAQVLPDAKRLLVTQEQVARCGLLFGSSFKTADPVWMQPLSEDHSNHYANDNQRVSIGADGSHYGDWFRSRTRQHHLIQSARPSRAAIEFTPGEKPSIVSTFEGELALIHVYDADGKAWSAENVRPGERASLQSVDKDAPRTWWNKRRTDHDLRGLLSSSVEGNKIQTACFYAEAKDPGAIPIDTLPSIRWQTPLVLISGPLSLKP